ncbi:MAG: SufD family Fe-S cluster assembly protein, partial [Eggerthellaceae bacterium]|nr:SufD family Fe-S cluster assembly protein [Eggerthellaceae bacterium]
FEHASAMLAPTWHFLKMNDTSIKVPENLAINSQVVVSMPLSAKGAEDEFENAIADAQEEWEIDHPEPSFEERAELEAFRAAEADATYGGTAQSAYQMGADALEDARSISVAFEHGTGDEVAAYLRYAAGKRIVVKAGVGETVAAQVVIKAVADALSVAAVDVVAASGSAVHLSVVVDSSGLQPDACGAAGTTLRVFAGENSQVDIVRMQTLDEGFIDIDDMGLFANSSAHISVSQTVLGAGKSLTGLATDLRGAESRLDIDTRYLGRDEQERDFNYIVRHHGPKTVCNLNANGVLAGASSKTLRGTIDLIRGAKGAMGSENETVLLVDEGVRNKTVPVILCNEDDVAGNHGATIGHIRPEQLFYLASRGLSQQAAERMFASAIIEQAAIDAVDDVARAGVVRLGERVEPGFAALFEEGV